MRGPRTIKEKGKNIMVILKNILFIDKKGRKLEEWSTFLTNRLC